MTGDVLEMMVRKLGSHATLTDDDLRRLRALRYEVRSVARNAYLIREGDRNRDHVVLLSGYAFRHKTTSLGGRQVVSLQIPGEAISCSNLYFDSADHNTQALTGITAAYFPRDQFRDLVCSSAAICHAMLMMTLIEASVADEWLLNLGRRPAKARLAHLLCEFTARVDAAGLTDGSGYLLPLTQEQIGDALGLTPIHVNRMLRELREDGLIVQAGRHISFPDRRAIARTADFRDDYLRLRQPRGAGYGERATVS